MGMADGYAQATGRVAHVNLHTAPGVGNAMGALFNAQANKAPLLVTAGQQVRAHMTMQANLTNRDAVRVPHPYVKWSYEPPRAQDVPAALARAIDIAALPPRGPAFVSMPMDDWEQEADETAARLATARSVTGRAGADPAAVHALARRLEAASRPALVAGPDIDASGAWDQAVELAERLALPVWATPATGGGRLGFPEDHDHFQGLLPPAIGPAGEMLAAYDLVLVVGSSVFPYYPYMPGPALTGDTQLVAITSDPDEAARAPMGDAIVADVRLTLDALLGELRPAERPAPEPREPPPALSDGATDGPIDPGDVHGTLADVLARRRDRRPRVARRARSRCATGCASRARPATTSAPAAVWASAWPPRSACSSPAGPAGRVRARRGLGAVRDHRVLDGRGLPRPGHLPRPAQRRVRDPQVVRARWRASAARRASTCPPSTSRRPRGYGVRSRRAWVATTCTRRWARRSRRPSRASSRSRSRPAWRWPDSRDRSPRVCGPRTSSRPSLDSRHVCVPDRNARAAGRVDRDDLARDRPGDGSTDGARDAAIADRATPGAAPGLEEVTICPHTRPSTMIGVATDERMPCSRMSSASCPATSA